MSICPRCAAPISDNNWTCPVCNYATKRTGTGKLGWRMVAAAIVVTLVLVGVGGAYWLKTLQRRVLPESLIASDVAFAAVIDGPAAWKTLGPLSEEESWVRQVIDWMRSTWQLDLGRDVMSWAGRIVIGAQVSNPFAPTLTFAVAVRDQQIATTTIEQLRKRFEHRGARFHPTPYEGVNIYSAYPSFSTGGRAPLTTRFTPSFAIAGGCIIVASAESAVRAAVDRFRNKEGYSSLDDTSEWKRLQRHLPKKSSIVFAFDPEQLIDKYTPLLLLALGGPPEKPQLIETAGSVYRDSGWLALAVEMDRESVHISVPVIPGNGVHSKAIRKRDALPADISALRLIPANTLGLFSHRLEPETAQRWLAASRSLTSRSAERGGQKPSSKSEDDFDKDLVDLLDGEVTYAILPADNGGIVPSPIIILSARDESSRKLVRSKLQRVMSRIGFRFSSSKHDGVEVIRASLPAAALDTGFQLGGELARVFRRALSGQWAAIDLCISFEDRYLLIATDEGPIRSVVNAVRSGETIEGNPRFRSMKSYVEKQGVSFGYLDLVSVADHCIPGGPLVALAFGRALNAVRQIDGIVVCGTARDGSFRYDVHVGASMKQLSDVVREVEGPLSLLLRGRVSLTRWSDIFPSREAPAPESTGSGLLPGPPTLANPPMSGGGMATPMLGEPRPMDGGAIMPLLPDGAWPAPRDEMAMRGPTIMQSPGMHTPGVNFGPGRPPGNDR